MLQPRPRAHLERDQTLPERLARTPASQGLLREPRADGRTSREGSSSPKKQCAHCSYHCCHGHLCTHPRITDGLVIWYGCQCDIKRLRPEDWLRHRATNLNSQVRLQPLLQGSLCGRRDGVSIRGHHGHCRRHLGTRRFEDLQCLAQDLLQRGGVGDGRNIRLSCGRAAHLDANLVGLRSFRKVPAGKPPRLFYYHMPPVLSCRRGDHLPDLINRCRRAKLNHGG
mmetsp:Transcript_132962/g.343990  ORF Transcript_132962/g.343990 Transcript_132962/m.343990 type:complete len:225 (+) Transcript_132962:422-1096(+)